MKQRKISQANARRYKKRVAELEEQARNRYSTGHGIYVRNVDIAALPQTKAVLENTSVLGFHLRAKLNGAKLNGTTLELYAVK